jgi:hypothetical protein
MTQAERATDQRRRWALVLSVVVASTAAETARAEVHLEGTPTALRVTTSQDKIADVLSAFAATFDIQYRTAIPLDATAGVSYSGSFTQVMSRLLDGYNYVIKREQDAIEIVVFGTRGEVAIPPPAAKPAPTKGIVSRWR